MHGDALQHTATQNITEKTRVRAQEDEMRQLVVKRAEDEAEMWKNRAAQEKANAEAARTRADEVASQVVALSQSDS